MRPAGQTPTSTSSLARLLFGDSAPPLTNVSKRSSSAQGTACFLDPRYKKRLIEFYMKRFHGDLYQVQLEEFVSIVKKMYHFYATSAPSSSKSKNDAFQTSDTDDLLLENQNEELDQFLYDMSGPDLHNLDELDKYMAAPLLKQSGQFNILSWWRDNSSVYPILAQIARDVMAIQVSTVASEFAFSAGGRVIDPYRSRLGPEMVEALICTKDWIAATRKDSKSISTIVADFEILESISCSLEHEDEEEEGMASDPDAMDDYMEL